jgi:Pilus assembly protein, PilP
MQRPGRKRKNSLVVVAGFAWLLFFSMEAWGVSKMVYKPPRSLKEVSLAGDSKGTSSGEQTTASVSGKTDPFKSFLSIEEALEKKKKKPRTYLETLDLSQLDLIATILNKKGNWAMVRDAKGLGHVIREGTLIGTNDGVVREIREGEVVILEKHRDFLGKVKTIEVVKKLPSQQ